MPVTFKRGLHSFLLVMLFCSCAFVRSGENIASAERISRQVFFNEPVGGVKGGEQDYIESLLLCYK